MICKTCYSSFCTSSYCFVSSDVLINQYDVRNAMALLVTAESLNSDSKHGELALQLKLYMVRGEYRLGNFKEAVECLVDAGYLVEIV